MNTTLKLLTTIALVVMATAATAEESTGRLAWDCGRAGAPTYEELRKSFGVHNLHLSSQTRIRLASRIAAVCKRGFEQVILVEKLPSAAPSAMVAAR